MILGNKKSVFTYDTKSRTRGGINFINWRNVTENGKMRFRKFFFSVIYDFLSDLFEQKMIVTSNCVC